MLIARFIWFNSDLLKDLCHLSRRYSGLCHVDRGKQRARPQLENLFINNGIVSVAAADAAMPSQKSEEEGINLIVKYLCSALVDSFHRFGQGWLTGIACTTAGSFVFAIPYTTDDSGYDAVYEAIEDVQLSQPSTARYEIKIVALCLFEVSDLSWERYVRFLLHNQFCERKFPHHGRIHEAAKSSAATHCSAANVFLEQKFRRFDYLMFWEHLLRMCNFTQRPCGVYHFY